MRQKRADLINDFTLSLVKQACVPLRKSLFNYGVCSKTIASTNWWSYSNHALILMCLCLWMLTMCIWRLHVIIAGQLL